MSTLSTVVLLSGFADGNDVALAFFIGSATFFLYNLHKPVTYFLRKQFIHNQRFTKTKVFQIPLSILTILSGIYCVFFFFSLPSTLQFFLVGIAFLSLGYVLPILGKGRRLRDVAYIKIFLIALVWAAMTVGLPYLIVKNTVNPMCFWQLFIERSCFIFALCIPFDIRDMDWDRQTNVKTIPLSIGVKNAKIWGISALTLAILLVFLLKDATIYTFSQFLIQSSLYVLTMFIVSITNSKRSDYFFYGLIDGLIFVQGLLLFLVF
ncbi:MAG: UbiA family prenyltransferase [Saprospiraceae bacterium]|nr:UbiA family prenyltransferase [Saprospiraceae bacterium]